MSLLTDIRAEKHICLGLARFYAPMETGNVRYNAIQAYDTSDGFSIDYDLSSAFYIYFLEEGTRYSQRHQGFIANFTYPAMASYINAKYADYSEELVGYYELNALKGNYDVYRSAYRLKESVTLAHGMRKMEAMAGMRMRSERVYDSALANMVNYGHMSNVHQWASNPSIEVEQPNLNQKF